VIDNVAYSRAVGPQVASTGSHQGLRQSGLVVGCVYALTHLLRFDNIRM